MMKKIDKLRRHYIICEHGRVGAAYASHFQKTGADSVISPYASAGKRVADKIIAATRKET